MSIGGVDMTITKMWERSTVREEQKVTRIKKLKKDADIAADVSAGMDTESDDNDTESAVHPDIDMADSDPEYIPVNIPSQYNQNRTALPTLSEISDRYGVSDETGAATASAIRHQIRVKLLIPPNFTESVINTEWKELKLSSDVFKTSLLYILMERKQQHERWRRI